MNEIFNGAIVSGSLIIAIGAQNAFLLKVGLLKQQVFWAVLTCFVCDAFLISLGAIGLSKYISDHKVLLILLSLLGISFLTCYGIKAFLRAWKGTSSLNVTANITKQVNAKNMIILTLGMTLLNPHVYLDTMIIIGGITATLLPNQRYLFCIGALAMSFCWFFGLGYGARLLCPIFARPFTWRILDILIGCLMIWIVWQLIIYVRLAL